MRRSIPHLYIRPMSPARRSNQGRVAIVGLLIAVVSFSSVAATASGQASTSDVGEVTWSQLGADINGDANSPDFGKSVAISDDGTRVVIGSPTAEEGTGELSYVQVHEWDGSAWQQLGNNITVTATGNNAFGYSVAISGDGNRIAIGDFYGPDGLDTGGIGAAEDHLGGFPPGAVRVFDWDGSTWQQVGETIEGTGAGGDGDSALPEFFGWSVALSSNGERVVAGSTLQARAFDYDSVNGWTQAGNAFGSSDQVNGAVAISADGNRVAVGPGLITYLTGSGPFVVQIFDYDVSDGWVQAGSDIDGDTEDNFSGTSVAMSADGQVVAVGDVVGDTGDGSVRVLNYVDGDWNQSSATIHPSPGVGLFGYSVAISADGTRIAASGNSPEQGTAEPVEIFDLDGTAWQQTATVAPGFAVAISADGNLIATGNNFIVPLANVEQLPVLVHAAQVEATPPAAEPAEPVSDTPTFTG